MPPASQHDKPVSGDRILLVDLCGTLYRSNTTFDFLREFLASDADWSRFERMSRSLGARALNRILPGDQRRLRAIRHLRGHAYDALREAADTFLGGLETIPEVCARIRSLAAEHDRTVLMSSSLDFIVDRACTRFEFDDYFATRLRYDDGICTGEIARDLLDNKRQVVKEEFTGRSCTLITDNHTDIACKGAVDRLIGVAGNARSLRFWSDRASEVVAYDG